jgi:hypothetical protein
MMMMMKGWKYLFSWLECIMSTKDCDVSGVLGMNYLCHVLPSVYHL